MPYDEIRAALEEAGAERVVETDHALRGVDVDAVFPAGKIRDGARALLEQEFLIEDLTAVDVDPELMVVYHFRQVDKPCRVALRVLSDRAAPEVPSIQGIFSGANWHEREAHDFFGVKFTGHPDLSPLILPEDAGDLRPLRKEGKRLKTLADVLPEFAPPPPAEEPEPEETTAQQPAPSDEG